MLPLLLLLSFASLFIVDSLSLLHHLFLIPTSVILFLTLCDFFFVFLFVPTSIDLSLHIRFPFSKVSLPLHNTR